MDGTMKRRPGDQLPLSSGQRRPRLRDPPGTQIRRDAASSQPRPSPRGVKEVTILDVICWSLITGATSWPIAVSRTRSKIRRQLAQEAVLVETELRELKSEATRWRARAAQLSQQSEAWKAGLAQGRTDVIAIVAATRLQSGCTCGVKSPDLDQIGQAS
jgi:hypothetical protein